MNLVTQEITFLAIAVTGMILGLLFDVYSVLSRRFRQKTIITYIGDLLYWLIATCLVFGVLVASNWGELRFYVFMALLCGVGLYYRLFSKYMMGIITGLLKYIALCVKTLRRILWFFFIKPVAFGGRCICMPFLFTGRKMIKWWDRWTVPTEKK